MHNKQTKDTNKHKNINSMCVCVCVGKTELKKLGREMQIKKTKLYKAERAQATWMEAFQSDRYV